MAAKRARAREQEQESESPDVELELLLNHLRQNRGFDFTGYKRASLERRIQKRMSDIRIASYPEYVDYLEVHPEEFNTLFNTILINVTTFFRDENAWSYLAEQILPELVARRPALSAIRVWSAGCATGEEAYTIAMIFAEMLGPDAFRDRVKIYGTDIDEEALTKARHATYSEREAADVPEALREKYFDKSDAGFTFKKDFRRQVIFGRHDLIQDAPISKVDLLVCRNAMMYFNAETQSRILARFHFALNDGGILFLGRAETMLTRASTFTPIDLPRRISTKVPRGALDLRDRLLLLSQNGGEENAATNGVTHARLREIAGDASPVAEITVDRQGVLVAANERARTLFSLGRDDVGRPIQDLKISYKPAELRSLIDRAYADRRPFLVRDVEWAFAPGDIRWLELQVVPIIDGPTGILGATVSFTDISGSKRLQEDLENANQELEAAYEELQSTNEELETTNEELQSTIEELETTNEELQSTNEELETMNEELQSTNEELSAMNDEVRIRSEEVGELNAFLESILAGLRGAVITVDTALQVSVWNPGAQELWGIRQEEAVGTNLLSLDIGIPVEKLKQPIKSCLSGAKVTVDLDLSGTNRRGRPVLCHVSVSPLHGPRNEIRGAILVMSAQSADGSA
jgi:two-component system, chemotaxis family, CheB/CheR fusion protein